MGRQNSRTFWRSRVAAICPAESFLTAKVSSPAVESTRCGSGWSLTIFTGDECLLRCILICTQKTTRVSASFRCPLSVAFRDAFPLRRRNVKTLWHYPFCILDNSKISSEITAPNLLTLVPSCRLRRNYERPRRMPCARFPLQSLRRLQRHKT